MKIAKRDTNIYLKDWLLIKPYSQQAPTDIYYLKLCNSVKKAIEKSGYNEILSKYFEDEEDLKLLACYLTSYFEDIISDTNIWRSFTRIHHRLYGKFIPFYEAEEYYEDEINFEDLCFLIWYFINSIQIGKFILPYNDFIFEISEEVFELFDDAWESAPCNNVLKSYFQINENETDFYVARSLIDTLLFKSYLFFTNAGIDLRSSEIEIIEKVDDSEEKLSMYLNQNRDEMIHTFRTSLLAMKGKEWVAEMLGENHPLSKHFNNMSPRILGYFLYKGQDLTDIFIEHIASGKKFKLTKKSFDHSKNLKQIDTVLYMGIVKWMNEWWFSGILAQNEFNADLILDEKNSIESRMAVSFLDHQSEKVSEILESQLKTFNEFNGGLQIAFMPSNEIESFILNFNEYYTDSLNLTEKEKNEAKKRSYKEGYFGNKEKKHDLSLNKEAGLVFFNPKSGCEMVFSLNDAFPLANNKYFDESKSDESVLKIITDESISKELALFCYENGNSKLNFFNSIEGDVFIDDFDFFLRFFKTKNYHTVPQISFTGMDNDSYY